MPSGPFDYLNRGNPDNPNYFDNPPPDTGNLPDPSEGLARGFGGNPVDNGNGGAPPVTPPPAGGGFDFSKFDLTGVPDWVKNMIPGMSADPAKALLIPSWLAAYKQWQDADKYKQTAAEAAKYGDPFGAANRAKYQGLLDASYTHPEDVLKDPGHMATIKSGLDAVGRTDASKGYLGSGNMEVDLAKYATDENAKYLDSYRKGLEPLTGSQFNPSAAGDFLMRGNEQAITSQNSALQSLFLPFMANTTQNYLNNNNPINPATGKPYETINPNGTPKPINWSHYTTSPADMQTEIMKITGGLGGSAADIMKQILSGHYQNISPSTRSFIEDMAKDPTRANEDVKDMFTNDVVNNGSNHGPGQFFGVPGGAGGGGPPLTPPPETPPPETPPTPDPIPDPGFPEPDIPSTDIFFGTNFGS